MPLAISFAESGWRTYPCNCEWIPRRVCIEFIYSITTSFVTSDLTHVRHLAKTLWNMYEHVVLLCSKERRRERVLGCCRCVDATCENRPFQAWQFNARYSAVDNWWILFPPRRCLFFSGGLEMFWVQTCKPDHKIWAALDCFGMSPHCCQNVSGIT